MRLRPAGPLANPWTTLDCRFENVSTQMRLSTPSRYSLFNVHCVYYSGYAANQWYEIDVTNPNVPVIRQQGNFFATSSSYDFNPHITTNAYGNSFVVWSATDPSNANPARRNAMVFFGGRLSADTLGSMGVNPTPLYSSTPYLTGEGNPNRWGDYSAVSIVPANPKQAWLTNEWIPGSGVSSSIWGTLISSVRY